MTTISTIESDPAPGQPLLAGAAALRTEPDRNCPLCPRLAGFREAARVREPEWFNSPVPSFGDSDGRLLIVGLAPGLQGANRTGRPFTGDFAGDLLYATLLEYGFAKGNYRSAAGRWVEAGRLPDRQRGALRTASEQAATGGNPYLPAVSVGDYRDHAKAARDRGARPGGA